MRVIARSLLALTIGVMAGRADTHADLVDLFASMAASLSDDNPAGFVKAIDRKTPDYDRLKAQVEALVQNFEVGNSVELLSDEGDEWKRELDLDWYLELRSRAPGGPSLQRRSVIHCHVEKQGKRWRVVLLKPAEFFDAPNVLRSPADETTILEDPSGRCRLRQARARRVSESAACFYPQWLSVSGGAVDFGHACN